MKCESRKETQVSLALPVVSATGPLATSPATSSEGDRPKGSRAPHSGMGWKRATVLGVIQLLMIVHVVQWLWMGTTIKPIEPSESMETVKDGVITVGAIFFAVALLSTALLGRWFCGWGCHVVMLQDFCGYLMKKIGIRPKLFRSRLLLWLPLALAVYMFLWPIAYRFGIAPFTRPELRWPGFTMHLTTEDFWSTFPGLVMGVPFLLVCGFLTVYLLGAKGYCTYACPYGGFFAPLDELAPVRIRVTDACSGCGHCTAVCTSNVRVHEEVRDYRMVVDQGCMKCLDCVSACPENALFVGLGKPAFMAERVKDAPARPSRFDLTWNEELVLAVIAVGVFFAMRGTIGVPLLFASGIAVCATYLAWLAYHTLSARDARLHRVQLKSGGQVQPAGYGLIALTALSLGGLAYVGVLNAAIALADFSRDKITVPPGVVFSGTKVAPDAPVARLAERARSLYTLALPAPDGIGVRGPWTRNIEGSLIWVSSVLGDYSGAEARVDAMISRDGLDEATAAARARVIRGDGRLEDALRFSESTWRAHPAWGGLREELVTWLLEDGRREEAVAIAREAVAKDPNDLTAMRRLSLVLVDSDFNAEVEEGLALVERTLEIAPGNPFAMRARATSMRKLGRFVEAERVLREAIELSPNTWQLHQELGEMLMAGDRAREAASILKRAGELRLQSLQNPAR